MDTEPFRYINVDYDYLIYSPQGLPAGPAGRLRDGRLPPVPQRAGGRRQPPLRQDLRGLGAGGDGRHPGHLVHSI